MKFILFFLLLTEIYSSELVETKYTIEDTNLRLIKILNKITDNSIKPVEKTSGFNYRYKSNFFSPFRFDIYVGKFSKKNEESIIRIESTKNGEAKVFKNILDVEFNKNESEYKFQQSFSKKSHILSQTLNWMTPTFSVWYNAYNSPFYSRNDTIIKSIFYLLYDIVVISITAFYINNSNLNDKSRLDDLLNKQGVNAPGKGEALFDGNHGSILIGLLAIPRLYRSFEAYNDTAAQNRMAELSFTYRF